MNLNDLKTEWTNHNKQLSNQLKINNMLLKKIHLNKSNNELKAIYNYELFGAVLYLILIALLCVATLKFHKEVSYLIAGISSIILTCIYLIMSLKKIKSYHQINFFKQSIIEIQKQQINFKLLIIRLRKWEIIIIPFFAIAVLIIGLKGIYNYDILQNMSEMYTRLGIIAIISIPVLYFSYKYFYDKKISNALRYLDELKEVEELT